MLNQPQRGGKIKVDNFGAGWLYNKEGEQGPTVGNMFMLFVILLVISFTGIALGCLSNFGDCPAPFLR